MISEGEKIIIFLTGKKILCLSIQMYTRAAVAEWLRCLPLNPGTVDLSSKWGHNHNSSYDTSTRWFQDADMIVIYLSDDNLLHNQVKINMFKLNVNSNSTENRVNPGMFINTEYGNSALPCKG